MSNESLDLTVAIPTYGRDGVLVETVRDILRYLVPDRMELIVADQSRQHDEATTRQLGVWEREGDIVWLRLEHPSLTGARNASIRAAKAPIVLFLDDDMLIQGGLFDEHLTGFEDETVAAVTGQVHICDDWGRPPSAANPGEGTHLHFADRPAGEMDTVIGCNHSVRRSAAIAVGGYDENFVASAHCEEFDFAQRLVLDGNRVRFNPKAWAIHLHVPSGGCRVGISEVWSEWTNTANLLLYAFRHGHRIGNFWYYIRRALRTDPLRKEILIRPWLWPWAWISFGRAVHYGVTRRKQVKSGLADVTLETKTENRSR